MNFNVDSVIGVMIEIVVIICFCNDLVCGIVNLLVVYVGVNCGDCCELCL